MINEHTNDDKKNYNKLYFTKKYKKNIDEMLYAFFIDADYENKTPYTILLTDNEIMNMATNIYSNIKIETENLIKNISILIDVFKYSIDTYVFKKVYTKYKVIVNSYIQKIDKIFYKYNKYCNFKNNINTNPVEPVLVDYLSYYELNMINKNINIIYNFPGFNLIYNPKNLKSEIIIKDKKDDIIYYKFQITPEILIDCENKINKKDFYINLKTISEQKNNDINHFITYLNDQKNYLPLIFF